MSASPILTQGSPDLDRVARRLIVTWRHPQERTYYPVALLDCVRSDDGKQVYEFAYLRRAIRLPGFRPFLGFSDLSRRYASSRLFPLFAERVMDPTRPDRAQWLDALGLDESSAYPMEVLARSGGRRSGDTIELL